jgi:hypothetical protein
VTASDRRLGAGLFLVFLLTYWLTTGGHFYASDDVQKLALVHSMFERGSLTVDSGWGYGLNHKRFSWFPLGSSLLMIPGYLCGRAAALFVPAVPLEYAARFFVTLENGALSAALVALVFLYLRWLGRSVGGSLFAALTLGLATMVWPYAKTGWSEPGATLLVFGGLFALQKGMRTGPSGRRGDGSWLLTAGYAFGFAALVRQELALVGVGSLAWLAWQRRREPAVLGREVMLVALPLAFAGAVSFWYEHVRYGELLALPNYRLPQQNVKAPDGRWVWSLHNLYRYTLSPTQGLLFFSPPAVLGLFGLARFWRAHRAEAVLLAVSLVPLAVFYVAGWGYSTWSWGLRYAYLFVPFLVLPLAQFWDDTPHLRPGLWAVAGFGVLAQVLGVLHDPTRLFERALAAKPGTVIQDVLAHPTGSPLVLAARGTGEALVATIQLLAGGPGAQAIATAYNARTLFLPDLWYVLQLTVPMPHLLMGLAFWLLLATWAIAVWRLAVAVRAAIAEPRTESDA